jgi:hypothetical protein
MNNRRGVALSDERKLRSLAWLYSLLPPAYDLACGVPFYERARSAPEASAKRPGVDKVT